jgi:hypothetical protein
MGLDALTICEINDSTEDAMTYSPDFSAKVINKARLLKVKHSDYKMMI